MEKTKTKISDILKVGAAAALTIALFSASLVGVNNLALAFSTGGTETLPAIAAAEIPENVPSADFVAPNLTLIECRWQRESGVVAPESAISREEAAQIGAQYIWDVFGASIDGMYVQMSYSDWESSSRTQWSGLVGSSPEAFDFESENWGWSFSFAIDAVTGERIDIDTGVGFRRHWTDDMDMDTMMAFRMAIVESGFFEKSASEMMEFVGLSNEELEAYTQKALDLAQRHFNNSEVVDIQVGIDFGFGLRTESHKSYVITTPELNDDGSIGFAFSAIQFTATDDTGREAHITIPSASANYVRTEVRTQHNDIIPNWNYYRSYSTVRIGTEDGSDRVIINGDDSVDIRVVRREVVVDGAYSVYTGTMIVEDRR
ncbi:MAG: hypothetical protein FWE04_02665 [Oscillospiraceae bacterium]|nr:hypothetical protein [Oscillospiraceae bacterium]